MEAFYNCPSRKMDLRRLIKWIYSGGKILKLVYGKGMPLKMEAIFGGRPLKKPTSVNVLEAPKAHITPPIGPI